VSSERDSSTKNTRPVHFNGATYGQIDSSNELRKLISQIEVEAEELAETIERCGRIILIAKAVIAVGGVLILAITVGVIRFDPTVMIGAIAAVIGGIVAFGSNTSTLKQATRAMEAAKARRAELITGLGADGGVMQTKWSSSE
jgi:hypothetical protein